jgi:glycosyltransferase involved in cell wall biosynthesis
VCLNQKVSVIVPVYKVEYFFERCLRSLFEQTLDSIEYIFINDCSPDSSMTVLEKIITEYPHRKSQVKIINHPQNMGLGTTRKDGMKAATGEYVISCDSDDWVNIDMYEKMYNKAIEENADIVCCGIYLEYFNKQMTKKYPYSEENASILKNRKYVLGGIYSAVWNKLIRRHLYLENDIYALDGINMWEDTAVTFRLRILSRKTVIIPDPFYHYNLQNGTSYISTYRLSYFKEKVKCVECIEKFTHDRHIYDEFIKTILFLRFMSKADLLIGKPIRDINRWKETYSETHKHIWKDAYLSLRWRILFWFTIKGFGNIACIIIDIQTKLKNILYSNKKL